jgi:hypothetical protein
MTRREQRTLLRNFCNSVRDALLAHSKQWPDDWNGHELRELVAYAFEHERTSLMREDGRRRRNCANEINVRNLY